MINHFWIAREKLIGAGVLYASPIIAVSPTFEETLQKVRAKAELTCRRMSANGRYKYQVYIVKPTVINIMYTDLTLRRKTTNIFSVITITEESEEEECALDSSTSHLTQEEN